MNLIKKQLIFKAGLTNDSDFTIRGIFSTGAVDRQGEVVVQTGWDLKEFMENPVILFAHDHYQPAIGKVLELGMNQLGNLEGIIQFAAKEYDFANTIYNLYKGGFMRAFSVGFMNEEYTVDQENDTMILSKNKLYEISAVNVPANAMALAMSKGIDCSAIEKMMSKGKEVPKVEEPKEEIKTGEAVEAISKSNKETILSAIKTLNAVLNAGEESDNQVGNKSRTPLKLKTEGGKKKVALKTLNRAIRELLEAKKAI